MSQEEQTPQVQDNQIKNTAAELDNWRINFVSQAAPDDYSDSDYIEENDNFSNSFLTLEQKYIDGKGGEDDSKPPFVAPEFGYNSIAFLYENSYTDNYIFNYDNTYVEDTANNIPQLDIKAEEGNLYDMIYEQANIIGDEYLQYKLLGGYSPNYKHEIFKIQTAEN